MDETTEPQTLSASQIKSFGIQGLLGNVADQRNGALADLNGAKMRLQQLKQTKDEQYFQLMGRLVKYEPDKVFDEVLSYAFVTGMFYHTQSHLLGVMSEIYDYTTKTTNKTYKAHFTIYGNFLKKCATDDELPISYTGRFLMSNYKDRFVVDKTKSEYKKMEDFIKIKEAVPEPVVEPEPDVYCGYCHQLIKTGEFGGIGKNVCGVDKSYCIKCYNVPNRYQPDDPKYQPEPEEEDPETYAYLEKFLVNSTKVEPEIAVAEVAKPKRKYVRKPK
jgi:hypothetical protein